MADQESRMPAGREKFEEEFAEVIPASTTALVQRYSSGRIETPASRLPTVAGLAVVLVIVVGGMIQLWQQTDMSGRALFWLCEGAAYSVLMGLAMMVWAKREYEQTYFRRFTGSVIGGVLGWVAVLLAVNWVLSKGRPELGIFVASGGARTANVASFGGLLDVGASGVPLLVTVMVLGFGKPRREHFFCPRCEMHTSPTTRWICGFCGQINGGPGGRSFFERCERCGRIPVSIRCPHCHQVEFFSTSYGASHVTLIEPPPPESVEAMRTRYHERNERVRIQQEAIQVTHGLETTEAEIAKDRLKNEIDLAELEAKAAKARGSLQEPPPKPAPKTKLEKLRDSSDRFMEDRGAIGTVYAEKLAMLRQTYASNPDELKRQEAMLLSWRDLELGNEERGR